jgi:hypothetical protein
MLVILMFAVQNVKIIMIAQTNVWVMYIIIAALAQRHAAALIQQKTAA